MKFDRSRILEYLRGHGHAEVDRVRRLLPVEVDTDPDQLLDGLGKGGLGKMIGG